MRRLSPLMLIASLIAACSPAPEQTTRASSTGAAPAAATMKIEAAATPSTPKEPVVKFSQEELRKRLSPEQYHVTQEKGTERAFTGKYWNTKADGTYACIVCGEVLFDSSSKFDSGCGWPSFDKPNDKVKISEHVDKTHGMVRTEVTCAKCGAHLGHVFDDGPTATGLRYCINSASIDLKEKK